MEVREITGRSFGGWKDSVDVMESDSMSTLTSSLEIGNDDEL